MIVVKIMSGDFSTDSRGKNPLVAADVAVMHWNAWNCIKAYHPECVGKDPSFLETGERWTCSSICTVTRENSDSSSAPLVLLSSQFHCIGCPKSVCKRCIRAAEFVNLRRKKSFCNDCLKLVLLIEENVDVDSDGGKVDFKDRETYEFLFKEYWELIKDKEPVTLQDLRFANTLLKKGERYKSESDSDKLFEAEQEDEQLISDFEDNMDDRMEDQASSLMEPPKGLLHAAMKTMKRKLKKKKEFIGWGSRSLIEFLTSIGKDPSKPLSQFDVHGIINVYIHENKLTHPDKKKKVVCDAWLHSIFGKKSVNRNRIYDLLEPHFTENQESLEEDEFSDNSEEEEGVSNTCKRQRRTSLDKKTNEKDNIMVAPRSCFASITAPNIKLVYLKRSLVEDLLKKPDTFEGRVVGSFVRVKCDPNDYFQKNSHQLLQVTGIMKASETGDSSTEIIMQVSNMNKGVHIRMLSDDDFTEEECEDLHQRVKDGQLKKPTIWELEEKARVLHEDITSHWIERELALLRNLIDRANEKGWRREYPS
ncbi:SWIB/MDM2 domain [Macleaya cordata]|uniref:SWIB/MDM2 domain n=1 Tax=Macleaya cordata TaxID=56857 RepID=A0A200QMB7_MACCD|nr:SWIB/MDM2 domain [Macleaya cordata]